ncbi:MAG: TetR/AcrR family transcriptional regulator [Peptococcaceae bacterium]|nr:TetR/AcrR family transcriptional regulator [Peptococcaceae bacterium]
MATLKLKGTKERIFDVAVKLFAQKGFEAVGMRSIAEEVGIQVSSLYNYFASKEELLDMLYHYFGIHRLDNRSADHLIKEKVEKDSALEVLRALSDGTFEIKEKTTKKKAVRMSLLAKIVLMRVYSDEKASRFFRNDWYGKDMAHLKKWLNYAIEIGRLRKTFDIETFSTFFWRQLIAMRICVFADPNHEKKILSEEEKIYNLFSRLLPLKDPV